jgi:hypothetical protein
MKETRLHIHPVIQTVDRRYRRVSGSCEVEEDCRSNSWTTNIIPNVLLLPPPIGKISFFAELWLDDALI